MKEFDKHAFLVWEKDPSRTGEGITPEQIFQAGIDAERKRLSKVPPVAWTGRGRGLLSVNGKLDMIKGEHHGDEFANDASFARSHDIALIHRPVIEEENLIPFDITKCGSGKCNDWCGLC